MSSMNGRGCRLPGDCCINGTAALRTRHSSSVSATLVALTDRRAEVALRWWVSAANLSSSPSAVSASNSISKAVSASPGSIASILGVVLAHQGEKAGVHDLHSSGVEGQKSGHGFAGREHRGEVRHGYATLGRQRGQGESGLCDQAECAFGADKQLVQLRPACLEQLRCVGGRAEGSRPCIRRRS